MSQKYNVRYCTCLLFLAFTVFTGRCSAVIVDRIVAVVNGEIITKSDIDKMVFAEFGGTPLLKLPKEKRVDFEKARKDALNSLVEGKLMIIAAEGMGISISNERLNAQILGILQTDSMEKAEKMLRHEGVDVGSFKKRVKNSLLLRSLSIRKGFSGVSVSDSEINDYFTKNSEEFPKDAILNLKQIVFRVPAGAPTNVWDSKRREASKTFERILSGSFEDKELKQQTYKVSELANLLRESVGMVSEGSWTPLLKMSYGYALFQVVSRERMGPGNNKSIRKKIYEKLSSIKVSDKKNSFLKELKNKAHIEILF